MKVKFTEQFDAKCMHCDWALTEYAGARTDIEEAARKHVLEQYANGNVSHQVRISPPTVFVFCDWRS